MEALLKSLAELSARLIEGSRAPLAQEAIMALEVAPLQCSRSAPRQGQAQTAFR